MTLLSKEAADVLAADLQECPENMDNMKKMKRGEVGGLADMCVLGAPCNYTRRADGVHDAHSRSNFSPGSVLRTVSLPVVCAYCVCLCIRRISVMFWVTHNQTYHESNI